MSACNEIMALLDEYADGTLEPSERALVETHLASCPVCLAELNSIRDLLADARRLPRSVLPERDLWSGIEARLGPATPSTPRWIAWGTALRIAAAIGLMLFGAGLALVLVHRSEPTAFAAEQARYTAASAALTERLAREPTNLSPATRAVVERNLAIVDAAIHEAEAALVADPGSQALEQMLVARYQQRLDLLKRATASARSES
jgi:anti-sigma-K factor RskA